MHVKLLNFIQEDGNADYKGIELSKIQRGSQVFPNDENIAIFSLPDTYTMPESADIVTLTEEEYTAIVESFKSKIKEVRNKPINELKEENEMLGQQIVMLELRLLALEGGAAQ